MIRNFHVLLLAFALSGCVTYGLNGHHAGPKGAYAWDGSGRDPNLPSRIRRSTASSKVAVVAVAPSENEAASTALPKYSSEWWAAQHNVEMNADAELAKTLIICRGCIAADVDQTGSIK